MYSSLAYLNGALSARIKLGFDQVEDDAVDIRQLKRLATPSTFNYFEKLIAPSFRKNPHVPDYHPIQEEEQSYLKSTYGVDPILAGSMPLNLNIPGDVDLDFYVHEPDPHKFQDIISRVQQDPRYKASPYNVEGANYYVFQRPARHPEDYPVDLAFATGPQAEVFKSALKAKEEHAKQIPEDLRRSLIEMKFLLKHTPLDKYHARYKEFKRNLDAALGAPASVRLSRKPLEISDPSPPTTELPSEMPAAAEEKVAAIVNLQDPQERAAFQAFVNDPEMYGHTTHNIQSVLNSGEIISALEALRRGQLKSFERGSESGTHTAVQYEDLAPEHIQDLTSSILTHTPDKRAYERVAAATGKSPEQVKMDFIRQHYDAIKHFVNQQPDPETFRQAYLSVPKLGPSIFAVKGGVLDVPDYGDTTVFFKSKAAIPSPHMNLVTDEYIIPQIRPFESTNVPISEGYVLAPKEKVQQFEKAHPEYKYVAREDLPHSLRTQLFKPHHSISEPVSRWLPNLVAGTLDPSETK